MSSQRSIVGTQHTVKHFSLHRVAGTELRVVSDVETGVLPVVQVEEAVIRGYALMGGMEPRPYWPHRWVTILILQNLQPLVRQLRQRDGSSGPQAEALKAKGGDSSSSAQGLPPGGTEALDYRPVVNVYDLSDPSGCNVFVNREAMVREGYWNDLLAIRALLAHEHAHPLAENKTTLASRRLHLQLSLADGEWPTTHSSPQPSVTDYQPKVQRLLTLLADKLCAYAPREVFANEVTIRRGFGEALLHLDRRNMANATRGVAGRAKLYQQLRQEVADGTLAQPAANLLLLIGDLRGYLDLALEVSPFYRTGRESDARELEGVLEATVFPYLEPEVARVYADLRDQYVALRADLAASDLVAWGQAVLNALAGALADKGLSIQYHLTIADGQPQPGTGG